MAHRLLVRTVRCVLQPPASVTSSYSTLKRASVPSAPPSLTSSRRRVSFSVQDQDDFTERVVNSELPVLVDFHAQ